MMARSGGRCEDGSGDPSSRIGYLESIRGLAALQVLLLHFLGAFAPLLVFAQPVTATFAFYIHLSPVFFISDGYSAVYIFFTLSGYVLTGCFARDAAQPWSLIAARIVRLAVPAMVTTLVAAMVMLMFGRPNQPAGALSGSDWFFHQWHGEVSILSVIRDGTLNALLLGYRDRPGVAFLAPWQQPVEQSLVAPLWTLSIEFYGSMIVLCLCRCAPRSRALWWAAVLLGTIFTIRSAYLCFFAGHLLARFRRAERPAPENQLCAVLAILCGVCLCVLAELWQPAWLRSLSADPTCWLFPGQSAPLQQKTFGAILVLVGIMDLRIARGWLSAPLLVRWSRLSFPLYLIHWPVLCGPAAALYLLLDGPLGTAGAGAVAIVAGSMAAVGCSMMLLPLDRRVLEWSRALRKLGSLVQAPIQRRLPDGLGRAMPAE